MKTINEPKYESFTGEICSSKIICDYVDKKYRIHILEELKKLKKYCKNDNCDGCPFYFDNGNDITSFGCSIAVLTEGKYPKDWKDWE
jgi:hypothetical protein